MAEYFNPQSEGQREPKSNALSAAISKKPYPAHAVAPCPTPFSDHVVKIEHGVEVPLRIFPAVGEIGRGKRPWLFWIHGGGWAGGKHYAPNFWVVPAFRLLGYHVISISYRLLPHAGIEEIWSDVSDAFSWCQSRLPSLVEGIDLTNYVVGGDSAGGHLATLSGFKLFPRPKAVIDVFGVVDFISLASDDNSKSRNIPSFIKGFGTTDEELKLLASDRDLSRAKVVVPWNWELEPSMSVERLQEFWGVNYIPSDEDRKRMDLNMFYTEKGSRFTDLLRKENYSGEEDEWHKQLGRWSPLHLLLDIPEHEHEAQKKNSAYPPTIFLHGAADVLVPVEQSMRFAEELRKRNVDTREVYCEGGSHGFEQGIGKPAHRGWDEYVVPVMEFVKSYLEPST